MFAKIKRFYQLGLYSKLQVAQFVEKGVITPSQYKQITGDDYAEGDNS